MSKYVFEGISKSSGKLIRGDLIQDEDNNAVLIANGWMINRDENGEFICFDCSVLEDVIPESIGLITN